MSIALGHPKGKTAVGRRFINPIEVDFGRSILRRD
jgi:hypothetical protein